MAEIPHLLVHDHKDNVGVVVVEGLTANTDMLCCITENNSTFRLTSKMDVPIGHKIALLDLKTGYTATKYGEDIGKIVADMLRVSMFTLTTAKQSAGRGNKDGGKL